MSFIRKLMFPPAFLLLCDVGGLVFFGRKGCFQESSEYSGGFFFSAEHCFSFCFFFLNKVCTWYDSCRIALKVSHITSDTGGRMGWVLEIIPGPHLLPVSTTDVMKIKCLDRPSAGSASKGSCLRIHKHRL